MDVRNVSENSPIEYFVVSLSEGADLVWIRVLIVQLNDPRRWLSFGLGVSQETLTVLSQ